MNTNSEPKQMTFFKKHKDTILKVMKIIMNICYLIAYGFVILMHVQIPNEAYVSAFLVPIVTIISTVLQGKSPVNLLEMKQRFEELLEFNSLEDVQKTLDEISNKSMVLSARTNQPFEMERAIQPRINVNMPEYQASEAPSTDNNIIRMNAYYDKTTGEMRCTPRA